MRLAGTQSWQVRWGDDLAVNIALYLRDTLALSVTTDPDIPLLIPSVPVYVPAGIDRAAVTQEWPGWWTDVLAYARAEDTGEPRDRFSRYPIQPGSPALANRPALRTAVTAFEPIAGPYFGEWKREMIAAGPGARGNLAGDLVRARETELGRRARPFRLTITELPVAGKMWHRLTDDHVLVSAAFAADPAVCTPALRGLITELA